MGKASLIIVLGCISIYLTINYNINQSISAASDNTFMVFNKNQVRNIANSTVEMLFAELGDDDTFRANTPVSIGFFDGTAVYQVIDTTVGPDDLIKIKVTATYSGETIKVNALTDELSGAGFIPTTVKAAVTTNNSVKTLGNLKVDGRDHDLAGNLIATSGTLGIWTTSNLTRSGNSKLAATSGGVDYGLAKSTAAQYCASNQVWPGGYPNTPDSVLGGSPNGFPAGTLKTLAQSGVSGSQYVTNPGALTYPLQGVTYVELASGGIWNPCNIQGEGVLIVHNTNTNAVMKNVNTGTFTGLIIADDVVHIHSDIIGALIGMTSAPSEGNCIGNGSGNVLYSSIAITNALSNIDPNATPNFGFGKKRLPILSWYE